LPQNQRVQTDPKHRGCEPRAAECRLTSVFVETRTVLAPTFPRRGGAATGRVFFLRLRASWSPGTGNLLLPVLPRRTTRTDRPPILRHLVQLSSPERPPPSNPPGFYATGQNRVFDLAARCGNTPPRQFREKLLPRQRDGDHVSNLFRGPTNHPDRHKLRTGGFFGNLVFSSNFNGPKSRRRRQKRPVFVVNLGPFRPWTLPPEGKFPGVRRL
jgi:hypothetical protein